MRTAAPSQEPPFFYSSTAQRGRGTARSEVEGAETGATFDVSRRATVAPSTASRFPSPVSLRFAGEDLDQPLAAPP
ncbi:Uncharacterised protein [Brevundimonas vesicularis]|uniref:Uncharacterized protein n=1 Tax=Brevundimonas vesicularis TaxID=41276 RepID=A0A2X1D5G7_BREVE|nr:Uncharacterised protein [Brevundimonas vesicularis]